MVCAASFNGSLMLLLIMVSKVLFHPQICDVPLILHAENGVLLDSGSLTGLLFWKSLLDSFASGGARGVHCMPGHPSLVCWGAVQGPP